jgi:SHS2 domain-containing protein
VSVPYRYREDISVADVAFEASGTTLSECFASACLAALGVMVEDPEGIASRERRPYEAAGAELDLLLAGLLSEIVYRKDAERLLLSCPQPRVEREGEAWRLRAELAGERIDASRHRLLLDVKGVTLHRLAVEQDAGGWTARVVLDV